jgi:hypothetical protein
MKLSWRVAAAAVVVGLAVGACVSSDDDSSSDDTGRARDSSTTTAEDTTSTTEATATSITSPSPADGSDVAACIDGTCEVLISSFPTNVALDPALGLTNGLQGLDVQQLTSDGGVAIALLGPGGAVGGVFVLYADGATSSLNGLDMQILAINDGTATLRISPT